MSAPDVIRNLNLAAFTIHAASSVVLVSVSNPVAPATLYGVRTRWVSSNGTCTGTERCVSEPWLVQMGSVNLLDVCIGFGLITAGYHLLQAVFASTIARLTVGSAYNPVRWLEYSVTAPLMFVVISVLCGIQSDYLVWVSAVGMWSVMLVGGVAEGMYRSGGHPATLFAGAVGSPEGLVLFLAAASLCGALWAPIFGALTSVNKDPLRTSSMPDVVYVIVGMMFGVYALFPCVFVVCSMRRSFFGIRVDGVTAEVAYNSLSLIAKVALHWLLWTAVVMQDDRLDRTGSGRPRQTTSSSIYVAAAVSVVVGIVFFGASLAYVKRSGFYGAMA